MTTFIERLSFAPDAPYNPIETAIHTNRYLLAKQFCEGARILDISCGEGYGSYLMAEHWGAAHVDALDVSHEALASAKARFASSKISWHCHDAQAVTSILPQAAYDLIVSLETIEHVKDPARFLEQLKALLKPGGVVIVSCPNDHWYYRDDDSNPFHLHKFHFHEFKQLAEGILGPNASYLLGIPVAGFGNLPLGPSGLEVLPSDMAGGIDSLSIGAAQLAVPPNAPIEPSNCAYFVGIWGAPQQGISSSIIPQSMDSSPFGMIDALRARLAATSDELAASQARTQALESIQQDLSEATSRVLALEAKLAEANEALDARGMELLTLSSRLNIRTSEYEYGQIELGRAKAQVADLRNRLLQRQWWLLWVAKRLFYKAKIPTLLKKVYHKARSIRILMTIHQQTQKIPVLKKFYGKLKPLMRRFTSNPSS